LPKLHGSRTKLVKVLKALGSLCLQTEELKIEEKVFRAEDFNYQDTEVVRYPLSLEKIARMYRSAVENGFASYAEA
jgi:5-methylcytosine-specific restriction protein B